MLKKSTKKEIKSEGNLNKENISITCQVSNRGEPDHKESPFTRKSARLADSKSTVVD